jgi:hypothetical protein
MVTSRRMLQPYMRERAFGRAVTDVTNAAMARWILLWTGRLS